MRKVSWSILVGSGILLFANAGYDELRGSTHTPSVGSGYSYFNYPGSIITKKGNPEDFHIAMTYQYFYASMLLFAGFIVYMIDRGLERVDPLSPDSDENIGEELRQDEKDEEKLEEKEKARQPEP